MKGARPDLTSEQKKQDNQLPSGSNKENKNSLNTLRNNKIPPLHIQSQLTRRYHVENNSDFRCMDTKRNNPLIQQSPKQKHDIAIVAILQENHKNILVEVFHKINSLPFSLNPHCELVEIDELLDQGYQKRLEEVLGEIQKLKNTINQMDESSLIFNAQQSPIQQTLLLQSPIQQTPPSSGLQNQLNAIFSSIRCKPKVKKFQINEESIISQYSITQEARHKRQSCHYWLQIFKQFKWTYKFALQLLVGEVGSSHQRLFEYSKSVYEWFKGLKIQVLDQSHCGFVLDFMRQCNIKMQGVRSEWRQHNLKARRADSTVSDK